MSEFDGVVTAAAAAAAAAAISAWRMRNLGRHAPTLGVVVSEVSEAESGARGAELAAGGEEIICFAGGAMGGRAPARLSDSRDLEGALEGAAGKDGGELTCIDSSEVNADF